MPNHVCEMCGGTAGSLAPCAEGWTPRHVDVKDCLRVLRDRCATLEADPYHLGSLNVRLNSCDDDREKMKAAMINHGGRLTHLESMADDIARLAAGYTPLSNRIQKLEQHTGELTAGALDRLTALEKDQHTLVGSAMRRIAEFETDTTRLYERADTISRRLESVEKFIDVHYVARLDALEADSHPPVNFAPELTEIYRRLSALEKPYFYGPPAPTPEAQECHNCANPPHEGPCKRTPTENAARPESPGKLFKQIEQLGIQLAGCSTAAAGWNQEPAKQGDYGWSPAYQDVLDLRRKYEQLCKHVPATPPADYEPMDPSPDLNDNPPDWVGQNGHKYLLATPVRKAAGLLYNMLQEVTDAYGQAQAWRGTSAHEPAAKTLDALIHAAGHTLEQARSHQHPPAYITREDYAAPAALAVGPHEFSPVPDNRYCGECGGGRLHQIHQEAKHGR